MGIITLIQKMNNVKEIDIKNCTYYFLDNMINKKKSK